MDSVVEAWLSELPTAMRGQFELYYARLVEWNEKVNLTAIVGKDDVYLKHFWDSVQIARLPEWAAVARGGSVIDVGTGAGFPGLPLAIAFPEASYLLLDSLHKRLRFLDETVAALDVQNVTLVHGRAEDLARHPEYRNRYDLVVSRAVGRLNVLLELTLPFVRPGGTFVAYKGPGVKEELEQAGRVAKRLGAEVLRMESFALPGGQGERNLVVVRQRSVTPPSYPRAAGTPQKNPLS